jgi:hypothetical protein
MMACFDPILSSSDCPLGFLRPKCTALGVDFAGAVEAVDAVVALTCSLRQCEKAKSRVEGNFTPANNLAAKSA